MATWTTQYKVPSGGMHTYSHEERRALTNFINELLSNDQDLRGIIPISPDNDDIFKVISEGLLLCKIVNAIKPGTIPESLISKSRDQNKFLIIQNHNLAIQGCKSIGCKVVSVGAEDLTAGTPHLILGLLWQCVRIGLLSKISIKEHPELVVLLQANESIEKFISMLPEENLLRWFNYHLQHANHHRRVNNFSSDVRDSENYLVLLQQIAPQIVPKSVHLEPDPVKRAELVCHYARELGCGNFIIPKDILDGNEQINLAFTAYLFNKYPALQVDQPNSQKALEEAENLLREKFKREEEERALRWKFEEEERRKQWEQQEQQRQLQWQYAEEQRRQMKELETAKLQAMLSEEERRIQTIREQEEAEKRERNRQTEEALRRLEEERRRLEAEREQIRQADEERQRQFETELRLREAGRLELEELRKQEECRRMELEAHQRAQEEELRKHEEHRRQLEQELVRQNAWQEYYRQQEELSRRNQEQQQQQQQPSLQPPLQQPPLQQPSVLPQQPSVLPQQPSVLPQPPLLDQQQQQPPSILPLHPPSYSQYVEQQSSVLPQQPSVLSQQSSVLSLQSPVPQQYSQVIEQQFTNRPYPEPMYNQQQQLSLSPSVLPQQPPLLPQIYANEQRFTQLLDHESRRQEAWNQYLQSHHVEEQYRQAAWQEFQRRYAEDQWKRTTTTTTINHMIPMPVTSTTTTTVFYPLV